MPTDFSGGGGRAPVRRQAHRSAVLNEPARPMFDLKFHPARWMEVNGELLPNLARLSHARGVNNVDHWGDTTLAEVHATRQGWTILPPASCPASMTPDGIEGYVRVYDGKSGPIHVTPWERPRALGSRVVWDRDEAGYHAWLRHLIAEGFIPAPDSAVVDVIREGLIAKRESARPAPRTSIPTPGTRSARSTRTSSGSTPRGLARRASSPRPPRTRRRPASPPRSAGARHERRAPGDP